MNGKTVSLFSPALAPTALDIIKIEGQPGEYSATILGNINRGKTSFAITGLKKDGMTAVFNSKESEDHKPMSGLW